MTVAYLIALFILQRNVPESPRYLFAKDLKEKFVECIQTIAKTNGNPTTADEIIKDYE